MSIWMKSHNGTTQTFYFLLQPGTPVGHSVGTPEETPPCTSARSHMVRISGFAQCQFKTMGVQMNNMQAIRLALGFIVSLCIGCFLHLMEKVGWTRANIFLPSEGSGTAAKMMSEFPFQLLVSMRQPSAVNINSMNIYIFSYIASQARRTFFLFNKWS